jgi:hypothetical protein
LIALRPPTEIPVFTLPSAIVHTILGCNVSSRTTAHLEPGPLLPLTAEQNHCNRAMKSAQMVIEKNYGQMANIFRICSVSNNYRLAKINPYAVEQYRFFFTNGYICFNGDQAGSVNKFGITPPTIEQYLLINV